MAREELRRLLRTKRRATWPQDIGLAPREEPGVYQHEVAACIHHSVQTYRRLEQGQLPHPALDLLAAVARLLNMSEVEWADLCRLALDCDPPHPIRPHSGLEVPAAWAEFIEAIPHPAWTSDQCWTVLSYNTAWANVFRSGKPPRNHLRWGLLDPDARENTLLGWERYWAPNLLLELRAAREALRDDPVLLEIDHAVREDPTVGPMYAALPRAYTETDGDCRPLRHHLLGDIWVTLLSACPTQSPRARVGGLLLSKHRPRPQRRIRAQSHVAETLA
ncbi:helix-turn-helix domain-containing protein [Streptomyces sp. NRRL F-4489]|uniref:MmyB family transcriptional regulator n=1 Tax=Streptomyces sp. NRRL F-4489 TaxID=1609095 RepID=UPI00099EE06F|nr:helix-turn-helix domain-containing protein [Streptomyces sp. NRRL F-4489]